METADVCALSTAAFNALSAQQFSGFDTAQIAAISSTQFGVMTPEQIGSITPASLNAFATAHFAALTSAQVSGLTEEQIAALGTAAIVVMSPQQLASFEAQDLGQCCSFSSVRPEVSKACAGLRYLSPNGVCARFALNEQHWDLGVMFDIAATSNVHKVGWASASDGLLVMDRNRDGVLNGTDQNFGALKLWVDANQDGKTDQGELHGWPISASSRSTSRP